MRARVLLLVLAFAGPIEAQSHTAVSVDGSAGGARVGGDERFKDAGKLHLSAAAHLVLPGDAARWIAGVVVDWEFLENGDKICIVIAVNRCAAAFPNSLGLIAEGGMRAKASAFHLDATAGPGLFDVKQEKALGLSAATRVATSEFRHVGFLVSVRGTVLPNTRFGTLWLVPVTLGVRFR